MPIPDRDGNDLDRQQPNRRRRRFGYRDGREPQQPISQGWVPAGRSAGDDPDRAIVPMRSRASRRTPPATAGGASTGADIGSGSVETGTMQS